MILYIQEIYLNKTLTSDTAVNDISVEQGRVVVTKDADFVDSFLTIQKPL